MAQTNFGLMLQKKLEEAVDSASQSISAGDIPDYPAYRDECGYIRGLKRAKDLVDEVEQEMQR